jgi:hypothetical protein
MEYPMGYLMEHPMEYPMEYLMEHPLQEQHCYVRVSGPAPNTLKDVRPSSTRPEKQAGLKYNSQKL